MSLIEASGVTVRYPTGCLAVENASLSIAPGELVVVLGANGSGKSTLLRCIAGMLRPTSGHVQVAGRRITELSSGRALADARMALGMVFQQSHLIRRRSVLSNVVTGSLGRHRGLLASLGRLPRCEVPLALECLDQVGLRALASQRAGTLSGGQAQRASIARALSQQPKALLADEPVASLDPEAAEEVMRLLRRLSEQGGLAVLCVLHQPDLARRYADRILGINRGRLVFEGQPARIDRREIASLYEAAAA